MNRFSLQSIAVMCLIFTVTAGCVSKQLYHKQTFVFDVKRAVPSADMPHGVLEIPVFSIVSPFAGQGLVTRTSSVGYQSDYYNEFLVSPEQMVTDIARVWFSESGMFSAVVTPDRFISPDYIIYGNITGLYGDFSEPANEKAVASVNITCISRSARVDSIVFSRTYMVEHPVEDRSARGLVNALSLCLKDILSQLEDDLTEAISES